MSLCESCHAGCCRSFAVAVTGADILRIESKLEISFWDFVCRWEDKENRIAQNYAPQFYFRDEPDTPFVICLTHRNSAVAPGTSKCRFLVECQADEEHPLGIARCGIYENRPSTCKAFPTKLNDTNELAVIYELPLLEQDDIDPAYSLCPRQWEPADLDPLSTVQDLIVAQYEMNFFHKLADLWNQNPGDWDIFPDFLRAVYENRVIPESETMPASAGPATLKFPGPVEHRESRAA